MNGLAMAGYDRYVRQITGEVVVRIRVALSVLLILFVAGAAEAQRRGGRGMPSVQGMELADSPELAEAINALLADEGAHMRMAPRRPATPADQFRAKQIVLTARDALSKYTDVRVAEQEGYLKFLPWIESQSIFHYNNMENIMLTQRRFDAARPVSLLYKKQKDGSMKLVGAMYAAPPDATIEDLDVRLPTSIAHWHEHVDFCGPQPQDVRSGKVKIDGATTARWLKITTREACDAAGGRFVPRVFGWMAHVYLWESDDPAIIWGGMHSHGAHGKS
jgi:hypothetical protein